MLSHIRRSFFAVFILLVLSACSDSRDFSLTQDEFQAIVNEGFPDPQIVTVDLPATARAHLYLQTPEIHFGDSRKSLNWIMPGEVDVDFAGKFSSGPMSLVLEGTSELNIREGEKAVFLDKVKISSKDIAVKSDLVQMLVLEALADIVAKRLDNLLLFTVTKDSPLADIISVKGAGYRIEPDSIIFSVKADK
ncbi:hypothetical protein [Parendozoicomonas sp. Alg238-R29]|uniref:hypothetical protein n=1 Tax=Parendozoicomonas sp. Alg238-R29 TaxID=2993446 RepID=UPI00248F1259|nr:hypothetical protein [Parendozoicomonas sp. Alg238-R29]